MKLEPKATGGRARTLAAEVAQRSGENPANCYQCGKCMAGCPMTFAMEINPTQVMRLVQLNQREAVLKSHTIWLCASCETCTTRCPQEVDLARVMDTLRIIAREEGYTAAEREITVMNQGLLDNVRSRGRVHETLLAVQQKIKTLNFTQDVDKGLLLMRKGKMSPFAPRAENTAQVQHIFENVARLEKDGAEPREGEKE